MLSLSSRPTFGTVLTIQSSQLEECVENVHPETFVIIHLFEPHVVECVKLNSVFMSLARKLPFNKFVKMSASEVMGDVLTPETLPSVLVYRGGEQIKTWIRFADALKPLTDDIVAMWLLKENCLLLDDEQREHLSSMLENGNFNFDRVVQLVDPKLLMKLTQLLH